METIVRWKAVLAACLCGLVGLGVGSALARALSRPASRTYEMRVFEGDVLSGRLFYIQEHLAAASLLETLSEEGILAPEKWSPLWEPDWEVSVAELRDFIPNQDLREELLEQLSWSVERARRGGATIPGSLEDYRMLVYDEGEQFGKPLLLGLLKARAPFSTHFYLATPDHRALYGGRLILPQVFRKCRGSE